MRKQASIVADASSKIVQQPIKATNRLTTTGPSTDQNAVAPGNTLFNGNAFIESQEAFSDEDLLIQTLRIKKAEVAYRASGVLIRTADEMSKTTLEVIS